jgi:hypothetical protein
MMGTNYDAASASTRIIRWDAITGIPTDTIPTAAQYVIISSSVFDAYNNQYFFTGENGTNRVDLTTGTASVAGTMNPGISAEIDMSSGEIFRVRLDNVFSSTGSLIATSVYVVSTDITTGTDTILGTIPQCQALLVDVSSYDSNAGIYYFVGIDSVLGTCLYGAKTTDTVFSFTKVPLTDPAVSIITLEYDNQNDVLYALSSLYAGTTSHIQIQELDPATGAMTVEADFPQLNVYQVSSCAFDQNTGNMVFMLGAIGGALDFYIYSTTNNTLVTGQIPAALIVEFECDNTGFALAKYGTSTRVEDPVSAPALALWPNPASDIMQLRADAPVEALYVTDVLGRTQALVSDNNSVDVHTLAPGYYFLRVRFRDGKEAESAFVKQ